MAQLQYVQKYVKHKCRVSISGSAIILFLVAYEVIRKWFVCPRLAWSASRPAAPTTDPAGS